MTVTLLDAISDAQLEATEKGLRDLYVDHALADTDPSDVVKAHALVNDLLISRGQTWIEPLGLMTKADYSTGQRKTFASRGLALPDGSFPIANEADLHNAIRLLSQAQDQAAAILHIIERAHSMGATHALPPAWGVNEDGLEPDEPATPSPGAHSLPGAGPAKPAGSARPAAKPSPFGAKPAPRPAGPPTASRPPARPGAGPAKPSPAAKRPFGKSTLGRLADFFKGLDDEDLAELDHLDTDDAAEIPFYVAKSDNEQRFTLGPVYVPNSEDAHGEWASPSDLQKAMWNYVAETGSDRTVYLQHTPKPAGKWVEVGCWPTEMTATMIKAVDGVSKAVETTFPAGTPYMGVIWEEWAFDAIKKGKITGFSMGGMARRIRAEIA